MELPYITNRIGAFEALFIEFVAVAEGCGLIGCDRGLREREYWIYLERE